MQRIITVTFHCAHNYGAVLQAYALQKYIEDNFQNCFTACLDYKPSFLKTKLITRNSNECIFISFFRNMVAFKSRYKRKKAFDNFIQNYIRVIPNDELDEENNIFIVGSDQVWNKALTNDKLDGVYTLEFVSKARKTSYAASIGTQDEELHKLVAEKICDFDKVGVREVQSKKLLEKYGIKNVQVNIDPVFLLSPKEYEALSVNILNEEYVLVYTLETNKDVFRKLDKYKRKYKTVSIGTFRNLYRTDYHFSSLSPQEYLGLIRGAKYIITNSFHAIAFAIIFDRIFEYIPLNNGRGIRIENLLSLINYNNGMYDKNGLLKECINNSKRWIEEA